MPLPGPDWLRPQFGDLQPLQVQQVDARLFSVLGITSRQGYAPVLVPTVQPVVVLGQEAAASSDSELPGTPYISTRNLPAVAGLGNLLQLFNIAGSGRTLYLDQLRVSGGTATTQFRVTEHNAEQATGANQQQGRAKELNTAVSSARVRYGAVALLSTADLMYLRALANTELPHVFKPAIVIPEGWGVTISDQVVNQIMTATIEWREVVNA